MTLKTVTRLEFLEALESGNYKQTQAQAIHPTENNCFCAVGLAMHLKGYVRTPREKRYQMNDFMGFQVEGHDPMGVPYQDQLIANNWYMTKSLAEDLQITDEQVYTVVELNDALNGSFSDVAEYLRKEWNLPKDG